jgi:hypothetical protein
MDIFKLPLGRGRLHWDEIGPVAHQALTRRRLVEKCWATSGNVMDSGTMSCASLFTRKGTMVRREDSSQDIGPPEACHLWPVSTGFRMDGY